MSVASEAEYIRQAEEACLNPLTVGFRVSERKIYRVNLDGKESLYAIMNDIEQASDRAALLNDILRRKLNEPRPIVEYFVRKEHSHEVVMTMREPGAGAFFEIVGECTSHDRAQHEANLLQGLVNTDHADWRATRDTKYIKASAVRMVTGAYSVWMFEANGDSHFHAEYENEENASRRAKRIGQMIECRDFQAVAYEHDLQAGQASYEGWAIF